MKVVIDSNVMVNAIYPRSKNFWMRQALERRQLTLCVSTDILDEYAEVITAYYDAETTSLFFSALDLMPNILHVH